MNADFIKFLKDFYKNVYDHYQNKCLFVWDLNEDDLSDILVDALFDNDVVSEREISRTCLLNIALYLGSIDKAKMIYEKSNFHHEDMCNVLMKALIFARDQNFSTQENFTFK